MQTKLEMNSRSGARVLLKTTPTSILRFKGPFRPSSGTFALRGGLMGAKKKISFASRARAGFSLSRTFGFPRPTVHPLIQLLIDRKRVGG